MLTYAKGVVSFNNAPGGTFEAELKLAAIERMPKRNALKLMKLMRECASEAEWDALKDAIRECGERTREAFAKASGERRNPTMKRTKFNVIGWNGFVQPMNGYKFKSPLGDALYVHQAITGYGWTITDPETGLVIIPSHAPKMETRAEVLAWANAKNMRDGKTVYEVLHECKRTARYAEAVHKFEDACATTIEPTRKDKPMNTKTTTAKKTATKKEDAAMKKTAKKSTTRKPTTKAATKKTETRKDAPKKHEYKPVPAELRFGVIESPWEGVRVYQKKGEGACIWVEGKTGQCAAQLKALGFKWSRKRRAWWRKPDAA